MRLNEEQSFHAPDGTSLFYRHWPATAGSHQPRGIILLHRGHEHSGRMQHIVDELEMPGYAMFAWDARGHGMSPLKPGDRPTLSTFVKDLDAFARHVSCAFGIAIENIAVVAQSVGSVVAAAWVHDYAPRIRCMVLAAPAFRVKLYVPFARAMLGLASRAKPDLHVKSYVKPSALTHDRERMKSYASDPLITRPISVRVLLGLYSTADRVIEDAQAIHAPVQLLISGSDWVVHKKPQHAFFERLGSAVKEKHVFEDFYHDTLGERDRHLAIGKARSFLQRSFVNPVATEVCERDFTHEEHATLSRPLPVLSPKRWILVVSRLALRTGGRLSNGIRAGCRTGFDSGSSLDYVYRNRPAGVTLVGRLIDWFYLNSIGWRGIRVRKQNLERALLQSAHRLRACGEPVRIVDIAAGHGRYVIETFAAQGNLADGILLRDYDPRNAQEGTTLIAQRGMCGVARFELGDAFSRESLAALNPRPTLGIVSGLYELFPDNVPVKQSLAGLADAIPPGGYLIYTGQPWHPQLEMIARVLSSHRNGRPWIMRRRTQRELDQLVAEAGFRKIDQQIDEWGIFTVSVAQRVGKCNGK
jgi:alpha-beta hydrolase superfamily lysophospholipase